MVGRFFAGWAEGRAEKGRVEKDWAEQGRAEQGRGALALELRAEAAAPGAAAVSVWSPVDSTKPGTERTLRWKLPAYSFWPQTIS
jgi:hypothetical protein